MRTQTYTALICMGLVTPLFAQAPGGTPAEPVPPVAQSKVDAAMKKIEQKKADRVAAGVSTTQPAADAGTIPDDPAAMRAEILRLRRFVTALREQNKQLASQLVQAQPDQTDILQRQQAAWLAAERERIEAERAALADDRARDEWDRNHRIYETPYGPGCWQGGQIILIQPTVDNVPPEPNPPVQNPPVVTPQPQPPVQQTHTPSPPDITSRKEPLPAPRTSGDIPTGGSSAAPKPAPANNDAAPAPSAPAAPAPPTATKSPGGKK